MQDEFTRKKIKQFKDMIKANTTLMIFHRKYIEPLNLNVGYNYFIKQINDYDTLYPEIDQAIDEYMSNNY